MSALEEGLVKDVSVQREDCTDITVHQELDLREVLSVETGQQIDALLGGMGFLVERRWHPLGVKLPVIKEGEQRVALFKGPTLSVRAIMSADTSAKVHDGEIGAVKQIATELNEELTKLLPEEARCWPSQPTWDTFNRQWSFRFNAVLREGTDDLEGDYKDICTTNVPPVPPDFDMPAGLSPEGQRAWEVIVRQLAANDDLKSGGHTHVFYTPQAWRAKGEDYGEGSELIVVHDGGNHAAYFNRDYEARILADKMELALRKTGLYPQPMTSWGTAIYKLEHNDPETEDAFEQEIAKRENINAPRPAVRPVDHVPGEVQEGLDDEGMKDLGVPHYVDVVIALLKQAGLEVSPELYNWKRGNELWIESFVPQTEQFAWATDPDAWEPPKDFMLDLQVKLKEAIGMDVIPNMSFQRHDGRWRISWAIKLGKGEFDESTEYSELGQPEGKVERIKLLFHNAGLHIYSMVEEPRDVGWGDLGNAKRVIQTYLQPTGDRPFSRDALGSQGLADFCRQVASQLGEILETMDVDWSTRFDSELGAWRISWFVGDTGITSRRVIEAYGDPEGDLGQWKELVQDFRPGDVVSFPNSHWPELEGVLRHPLNHEADQTWYVEFGRDKSLDGMRQASEMKLVRRPTAYESLEDEGLGKEVGGPVQHDWVQVSNALSDHGVKGATPWRRVVGEEHGGNVGERVVFGGTCLKDQPPKFADNVAEIVARELGIDPSTVSYFYGPSSGFFELGVPSSMLLGSWKHLRLDGAPTQESVEGEDQGLSKEVANPRFEVARQVGHYLRDTGEAAWTEFTDEGVRRALHGSGYTLEQLKELGLVYNAFDNRYGFEDPVVIAASSDVTEAILREALEGEDEGLGKELTSNDPASMATNILSHKGFTRIKTWINSGDFGDWLVVVGYTKQSVHMQNRDALEDEILVATKAKKVTSNYENKRGGWVKYAFNVFLRPLPIYVRTMPQDPDEEPLREGLEDEGLGKELQSSEEHTKAQQVLISLGFRDVKTYEHQSNYLWASGITDEASPQLVSRAEHELKDALGAHSVAGGLPEMPDKATWKPGQPIKYTFAIYRRGSVTHPSYESLAMLVDAGAAVRKCVESDGKLTVTGEWPGIGSFEVALRESEYKDLYAPMRPIEFIESIIREGGVTKLVRTSEKHTTVDWKQSRQVPAVAITWEGTLDPALAGQAGYPTHTPDGRKIEVADLVHAQHIGWKIKEVPGVLSVHVDTLPVTDYVNRTRTARFLVVFEEPTKASAERIAYQRHMREDSQEGDDNRVAIVGVFRKGTKSDDSYEVLVCKREVDPEAGKWCIPGGHAKEGEDIITAAKREMKEETHLDLEELVFVKKMANETRDAMVSVYGTMLPEGDKAKAGDDAEKLKWVPVDDLPELAFDNNELVKEIAAEMKIPVAVSVDESKREEPKKGFIIVFEGIDGAGKTTQVERLADWLNSKDYSFVNTKWNNSKLLSDVLWKAKRKQLLTPMLFSLLHASDMHLRYEKQILPALAEDKVVLCDRYYYTSYVRDAIRGIDPELLDFVYNDFREPDLVFHCVVPVEVAVERLMQDRGVGYYSSGQDVGYDVKGRRASTEKYEQDMADRYAEIFKGKSHVVDLDMDRPVKEIAREIKKHMRKLLNIEESPLLAKAEALRHQLNEDQENVVFTKITDEMLPSLEEAMKAAFPGQADWVFGYCMQHGDPDLSVVVIDGEQVLGFYILGERDVLSGTAGMDRTEDLSAYEHKRGVEGIALGVVPQARGKGIGNRLKDYPKSLGADYIWGLQLADLNNLEHWLKRRRLVAKTDRMYATLQDLK